MDWPTCAAMPSVGSPQAPCCCPRPWATASYRVWAVAGLYGAIAVCLFAALFGGTRGMIGGPNTFATVTTAVVVAEHTDNLAAALTTAMLAGLILVGFGVLKLGRYMSYIPYSLLSSFFTAWAS